MGFRLLVHSKDAYDKTATAACQLLGFSSFGSGTQHMIGERTHGSNGFCCLHCIDSGVCRGEREG